MDFRMGDLVKLKYPNDVGPGRVIFIFESGEKAKVQFKKCLEVIETCHLIKIETDKKTPKDPIQRHEFALGEKVYLPNSKYKPCHYFVTAHLCAPSYVHHYTLSPMGDNKRIYAWEFEISREPQIASRGELFKRLGPDAQELLEELEERGDLEINLPRP